MKTLSVKIPDGIEETVDKMQLAANLFEKGVLTSGQVPELVGISKREFLETVGQFGVSIF